MTIQSELCQGEVWERLGSGWGRSRPCHKKAVKDGYCATHHPDAEKARRDAGEAEYKAKRARESRKRLIEYKRRDVSNLAVEYIDAREVNNSLNEAAKLDELIAATKELRRLLNEDKES